jgi:hypothetical protein
MKIQLQNKLIKMIQRDTRHRLKLISRKTISDGYDSKMEKIHIENGREFEIILAKYGWPDKHMVGKTCESIAWTIVQHSISLPKLQFKVLAILKNKNNIKKYGPWIAMMEDRIKFMQGKKQKYGTNFDWNLKKELKITPIVNPKNVDIRRKAMGLGPIQETINQTKVLSEFEIPPKNIREKRDNFEKWAKKVGWR